MIGLILLAAGYSSRFGENKLIYPVDGIPMFRHMLDCALAFQERSVYPVRLVLVTAYEAIGAYAEASAGFRERGGSATDAGETGGQDSGQADGQAGGEPERILVYNRRQELGISHSIALGIGAAGLIDGEDGLMFAVCDQPYLKSGELLDFAARFYESGKGIGCLSHGGVSGNPVIFKRCYQDELLSLTGDTGGKKTVRAHEADVFFYETADAVSLKDIDRKEEVG